MKKMMFNDRYALTEAVIKELKIQTRRLMKNQSGNLAGQIKYTKKGSSLVYVRADFDNGITEDCPYAIGEIVAVAQSYKDTYDSDMTPLTALDDNLAEREDAELLAGWLNKMFVKADLMPHQIRILDVRAEQLQAITDEDCLREGIVKYTKDKIVYKYDLDDGFEMFPWRDMKRTPQEAFASLIDKISGKGTWQANPYVWRIEFELVETDK